MDMIISNEEPLLNCPDVIIEKLYFYGKAKLVYENLP